MPRMPTVLEQRLGGFVLTPDAHDLVVARVILAEVGAQPALPFLDLLHGILLATDETAA
jgi:hypothetical protein